MTDNHETSTEPTTERRRHRARRNLRGLIVLVALLAVSVGLLGTATPAGAAGSGTVTGLVRTSETGQPIKDAYVSVRGTGLVAVTGADGRYTIPGVPSGSRTFDVDAPCRFSSSVARTVDGPATVNIAVEDAFVFDSFGHVCRSFGTNFALDPLVTNVLPLVGDDESTTITMPFTVPFYGQSKSSLSISTNGYVSFGAPSSVFANKALFNGDVPADSIFAFWDDLVVDQLSAVKTGVRNAIPGQRVFKVRWEDVRFSGDLNRMSIELSLAESGEINVIWTGVDANAREQGNSATIGIKSSGSTSLQQSSDKATLVNNLGVQFVENGPPIANAGADKTVTSGVDFAMDASGSVDPDANSALTFQWIQLVGSGQPITSIPDDRKAKTSVKGVKGPMTLTYEVRVRDQFGRPDTDRVTVTVKAPAPK